MIFNYVDGYILKKVYQNDDVTANGFSVGQGTTLLVCNNARMLNSFGAGNYKPLTDYKGSALSFFVFPSSISKPLTFGVASVFIQGKNYGLSCSATLSIMDYRCLYAALNGRDSSVDEFLGRYRDELRIFLQNGVAKYFAENPLNNGENVSDRAAEFLSQIRDSIFQAGANYSFFRDCGVSLNEMRLLNVMEH